MKKAESRKELVSFLSDKIISTQPYTGLFHTGIVEMTHKL